MPGKPYQSKLRSYHDEIFALLDNGMSYRQVAEALNRKYGLGVSHNAVFSYVKPRRPVRRGKGLFYEGLAPDIRDALIKQIAAVWTHDSTAIEGNTLTLGETVKVLELGLTISGKSLREHQEVYGHARAIDLIYRMIGQPAVTEQDLFDVHRAVMDKTAMDIMKPVGGWKQEFNGATGVVDGKKRLHGIRRPSRCFAPDGTVVGFFQRQFGRCCETGRCGSRLCADAHELCPHPSLF